MKRYQPDVIYTRIGGSPKHVLHEHVTGDYVLHSEAEAAIAAEREALDRLVIAAQPFTSPDVVDETSGTIPLMEELAAALEDAERRRAVIAVKQ